MVIILALILRLLQYLSHGVIHPKIKTNYAEELSNDCNPITKFLKVKYQHEN